MYGRRGLGARFLQAHVFSRPDTIEGDWIEWSYDLYVDFDCEGTGTISGGIYGTNETSDSGGIYGTKESSDSGGIYGLNEPSESVGEIYGRKTLSAIFGGVTEMRTASIGSVGGWTWEGLPKIVGS